MTDANNNKPVTRDELVQCMASLFKGLMADIPANSATPPKHHSLLETLEELVCEPVDAEDDKTRHEQERSDKILQDFGRSPSPSDGGGGAASGAQPCEHRRPAPPPSEAGEKLPGLPKSGPDLVTRPCISNNSPMEQDISDGEYALVEGEHEPKIQHGGCDGGAKIGFTGQWDADSFVTITGSLEEAKARAAANRKKDENGEIAKEIITLAGREVVVYPSGASIGVYYAYHIAFDGYDVFIHASESPKNNSPQIRVDYRAESILRHGSIYGAQAELLEFLAELGFTKTGEKLSRIDLQIMIDEPVTSFYRLIQDGHAVTLVKKYTENGAFNLQGKEVETFTAGSTERIQLCIYDKRKELGLKCNAKNAYKLQKTIENIGAEWWYSKRPITRIEFRIGREVLKSMGIDSLEDFRLRERAMVEYLTHDWFRLLAKKKVRGAENDAALHPLWERVQAFFFQHFSCAEIPEVKRQQRPRISADSERLTKQAVGCLKSSLAGYIGKLGSVEELWQSLHELLDKLEGQGGEKMLEKYNKRVSLLQAELGVEFGLPSSAGYQATMPGTPWTLAPEYSLDPELVASKREKVNSSFQAGQSNTMPLDDDRELKGATARERFDEFMERTKPHWVKYRD